MTSSLRLLRSTAGRARSRLRLQLRRGNAVQRWIYYSVFSDAFTRERLVVAKGHQEYTRRVTSGTQEYLLRRNIHMLEKGLTMRPRRSTFGVDYIAETVELFQRILTTNPQLLSRDVEKWAREVLERYFEATARSASPVIDDARRAYTAFTWESESDHASGPHAPWVGSPPVDIDAITALAVRRKSVRWFTPDRVERELVDNAMRVAAQAPSACNRQPFTFRIFDDPGLVAAIAKIPMGTAGYSHNLPAIAVIVGDLSAFIDERDRHLIYTDGCLAAMSFIFGLESQGIASVCINWPDIAKRERRMTELLNIAPHERVVMLIGFGYADETGATPFSAKRSLADLRSYNTL